MIAMLLLAFGLQTPEVMRVEEDWELILNVPADEKEAPQLHSVISPHAHTSGLYAQITWNFREKPDFTSGGMQIQAWYDESFLVKSNFGNDAFTTVSETITWTQGMETTGSWIKFFIEDGQSQTWGDFGGAVLTLAGSYAVGDLNEYDTNTSATNSWITLGAQRVSLMRIKEVRYYDASNNLINTDTTPKIMHGGL